jgi:hypothetical protein
MQPSKPFRLSILALSEWLMVLPATVFLAAAALRLFQPRQYQPAKTSWVIFEWTTGHISHLGAALLFLGMPGVVLIAGCSALLWMWHADQALRHDVVLGLTVVRRHLATAFLAAATVIGATILALAAAHLITD